jgi:hypothetical protein
VATALLGIAGTAWAAFPLRGTGTLGWLMVVVAGVCVLGGVLRLLAQSGPATKPSLFATVWSTVLGTGRSMTRRAGWESAAVISMVVLETLHHSRPWHTAVLAVVVVSYLLAVHQAEQPAPVVLWRGELRVLVVSLPLMAVATGVAMAPAAGAGATSGWLELIAALAAILAVALALPL